MDIPKPKLSLTAKKEHLDEFEISLITKIDRKIDAIYGSPDGQQSVLQHPMPAVHKLLENKTKMEEPQ